MKFTHWLVSALVQPLISLIPEVLCFELFNRSYIPIVLTALADGALNPVLALCAMKEAIALLALMTLSHIVEHQGNLAPLIEVGSNLCTTLSLGIPERYEMMSAVPHMFFSTFTFIDL